MMIVEQILNNTQTPLLHIADVSGSALFNADCMDILPLIPNKSVQLILADLPYGTTSCAWDCIITFDELWKEYGRIIKDNGAIVLTASQPFTSALVNSKIEWFKYALVWEKERPSNPAHAKIRFMKWHEDILIFAPNKEKFNPQKEKRLEQNKRNNKQGVFHKSDAYGEQTIPQGDGMADEKYLSSVLKVNVERGLHPTQKPLKLFKTLISAFTDENDYVLDNTMGVGTTCLGAKELNRKFIGIEKEVKYYDLAVTRVFGCRSKTSQYKGVSFDKRIMKWGTQISINGKIKNLGYYENEKDAAIVYNQNARQLFGEFANLNQL